MGRTGHTKNKDKVEFQELKDDKKKQLRESVEKDLFKQASGLNRGLTNA